MICLYVDDLIYAETRKDMIAEFKNATMKEFEMSNIGLIRYFLGIQVKRSLGEISISQEKYVADLFKIFNMSECKPITSLMAANKKSQQNDGAAKMDSNIFQSLVGSLIYLTNLRPDILFSVSIIFRFIEDLNKLHFTATKRIMRYL
jgi:hypothetical protein